MVAQSKYFLAAVGLAGVIAMHPWVKDVTALLEATGEASERKLVGLAVVYVYHMLVAEVLKEMKLNLPSSLTSMLLVYAKLQVTELLFGVETAEQIAEYFDPAVGFLGKWMPAWLAPPLVALPNALAEVKGATPATWAKLGGLHFGLWLLTLIGSGALARVLQRAQQSPKAGSEAKEDAPAEDLHESKQQANTAPKSDTDRLLRLWALIAAATLALVPITGDQPFLLSATITGLLLGQKLPAGLKTVIHPLVVSGIITAVLAYILQADNPKNASLRDTLTAYFTKQGLATPAPGAGDVLFELLAPSCTVLGFRMFSTRHVLARNLVPLLVSVLASSLGSLFLSPYFGKQIGLPSALNLMLSQRSVMSSLAIPCTGMIGASTAMSVASILITGVYGASIGQQVLTGVGIDPTEAIARGTAIGAASHSIGTASLMAQEPQAAAISSVSMCLAGIFHTIACSFPSTVALLRELAACTSS